MGFFARVKNLWTGFLNLWISGAEAANPRAVYEARIAGMIETHQELKDAVSNLVYLRNKSEAEFSEASTELAAVVKDLATALQMGNDEAALAEVFALHGDRIAAVGQVDRKGRVEIDATGLVVAVPILILHSVLRGRSDSIIASCESHAARLLTTLAHDQVPESTPQTHQPSSNGEADESAEGQERQLAHD